VNELGRKASLSGLVFAVLFGVGSGLWVFEQPSRAGDTDEVVQFFESTSVEILIGGTMSLVSLVFLVWFGAVLRHRLAAVDASAAAASYLWPLRVLCCSPLLDSEPRRSTWPVR